MLPIGLTYPINWPVSYIGKDLKMYRSTIKQVHYDDVDAYYNIDVLEGPFIGERQTVSQRLYSYVDVLSKDEIKRTFAKYTHQE
jgi:hypothetical protein